MVHHSPRVFPFNYSWVTWGLISKSSGFHSGMRRVVSLSIVPRWARLVCLAVTWKPGLGLFVVKLRDREGTSKFLFNPLFSTLISQTHPLNSHQTCLASLKNINNPHPGPIHGVGRVGRCGYLICWCFQVKLELWILLGEENEGSFLYCDILAGANDAYHLNVTLITLFTYLFSPLISVLTRPKMFCEIKDFSTLFASQQILSCFPRAGSRDQDTVGAQ